MSIALGNEPSQIGQVVGQVAGTLVGLQFSQAAESEADEFSVEYLASGGRYACNGAATFFQKLTDMDLTGNTPAFLSTHPPSDKRVEEINAKSTALGCSTSLYADTPGAGCRGTTEYDCFRFDWLPDID